MLRLPVLVLVSALAAVPAAAEEVVQKVSPAEQAAHANCGPNKAVDEYLKGLGAHPFSAGMSNAGTVVELMTHDDGSWALVEIFPSGVACILRAGADMSPSPEIFIFRAGPQV